jgi:hypothetical protein
MTHSDLHMAVRLLLRGTPYASFLVSVHSAEAHPGRVAVEYVVTITGLDRTFKSGDPKRLLTWVRQAVKAIEVDDAPPAVLLGIGAAPRLRRVK